MSTKRTYLHIALVLAIAAAIVVLFYKIIAPFFVPIVWAGVFAILFNRLFERIVPRMKNRGLAALLVTLMIAVVIIGPVSFLFVELIGQGAAAVEKIQEMYKSGQLDKLLSLDAPWMAAIRLQLANYFDVSGFKLDQLLPQILDKASGFLIGQTSSFITNGAKAILNFLLMMIATYYFLKDGHFLVDRIKSIIPLPRDQVNVIMSDLRDLVSITMYSGVAVALLQGLLGWLLFTIMGIDSPVFWGAVMAFLSLLPLLGAFLVYIPAGLILLLTGSPIKGLLTIVIGTVIISQVDNVVRPWIISGKSQMHPLLTFFSILGGIAVFGFVGVVIGPIVAAVFMLLMDILARRRMPDASETIPPV